MRFAFQNDHKGAYVVAKMLILTNDRRGGIEMTTLLFDCNHRLQAKRGTKICGRIARIKDTWDTKETEHRARLGVKRRARLAELLFGEVECESRDAVA